MPEVEFSVETAYQNVGRNRFSKPCGVQVRREGGEVHIQAINSAGGITKGLRIVIPMTHLREVRDAIDDILAGQGVLSS